MSDDVQPGEVRRSVPNGIKKSTFFLSVALVALVGFVAGTRSDDIYAAIGPVFGVKVATPIKNFLPTTTAHLIRKN